MRILVVSDLHYSLRQFDWVVAAAPEFDLVVLAGDHLDISSSVSLDAQVVVVLQYLQLLQGVGRGRRELGQSRSDGHRRARRAGRALAGGARSAGIPTDGDSLLIGDTLITICPWWDGPAGRATVAAQLAADAVRRPRTWVWVYHWPPLGSPTCWTGHRDYGDADLGGWIDEHRPDVVLTGHVHDPPFRPDGSWVDRIGDTWIFNAGRQIGPTPTRIELGLDEQTATWVSLLGSEVVSLTDAAGAGTNRVLSAFARERRLNRPGQDRAPNPGWPAARGAERVCPVHRRSSTVPARRHTDSSSRPGRW